MMDVLDPISLNLGEAEPSTLRIIKPEHQSMISAGAHWVKVLVVRPNTLSSVPGTHVIQGEDQLLQLVL